MHEENSYSHGLGSSPSKSKTGGWKKNLREMEMNRRNGMGKKRNKKMLSVLFSGLKEIKDRKAGVKTLWHRPRVDELVPQAVLAATR